MKPLLLLLPILPLHGGAEYRGPGDTVPPQEPEVAAAEGPELLGSGRLAPSGGTEIEIWPRTGSLELVFVEVVAQGTPVEEGQVIARFDDAAMERRLHDAELAVMDAERKLQLTRQRMERDLIAAEGRLAAKRTTLAIELKRLEAWREHDLESRRAQAEMSRNRQLHSIEDQEDELAQLMAMYAADELVDATEEIVIKRSQRSLGMSKHNFELSERQRQHQEEVVWPLEEEEKMLRIEGLEQDLELTEIGLDLQRQELKSGIQAAEIGLERAARNLQDLRADQEALVVRAPARGLLFHGGSADYEGAASPRHGRGDRAPTRKPLFTIAPTGSCEAVLSVGGKQRAQLRSGTSVSVEVPDFDLQLVGELRLDPAPSPDGTWRAVVRFAETQAALQPGMKVDVALAR